MRKGIKKRENGEFRKWINKEIPDQLKQKRKQEGESTTAMFRSDDKATESKY